MTCLLITTACITLNSCSEGNDEHYLYEDSYNNSYGKNKPCYGNYKGKWLIGQDTAGTGEMTVAPDYMNITSLPLEQLLRTVIGQDKDVTVPDYQFETGFWEYGFSTSTYYYYITRTDYMFNAIIDGNIRTVKMTFEDTADNISQAIYSRDTFVLKLRIKQIYIHEGETVNVSPATILTFTATRV